MCVCNLLIFFFPSCAFYSLAGKLMQFFFPIKMWQGVELEDFVSGPRELLLKLVEDHYPLPPKPDCVQQGLHRHKLYRWT